MSRKSKRKNPAIVLTRGVQEYRATIPVFVMPDDSVLEVGCAWGTTSRLLARRARRLVAVDKSETIHDARRLNPDIRFEQLDAFDVGKMVALGPFTKIYIDLSGSGSPVDVLRLIRSYISALDPDAIVVKNTGLRRFAELCVIWQR